MPPRHIIETRGYDMFDTMFLIKLFCLRLTFMSCLWPGLIASRVSSQFHVTHLVVEDVLYILHGIAVVVSFACLWIYLLLAGITRNSSRSLCITR